MSRLCRLKTKTHGEDGLWAYNEINQLRTTVAEQQAIIKGLNDCIGGEGSTTTDNIVLVSRLENTIAEQQKRIAELEAEIERKISAGNYVIEQLTTAQAQIKVLREALNLAEPVMDAHAGPTRLAGFKEALAQTKEGSEA